MLYQEAIQFLNLSYPVTQDSIKQAYRRLAKDCHPDSGGSEEQFKQLTQAYEAAIKGPVYEYRETYTASDTSSNYNDTYHSKTYYDSALSYIIYLAVAGIFLAVFMIFDMYFDIRFMFQDLLNSITYLHMTAALIVGFVVISVYKNPAKLLFYFALAIFAVVAWQELLPYYWQVVDMLNQFDIAINQINYML